MINSSAYSQSPIGAKLWLPVWSEAECGKLKRGQVRVLAGFLTFSKIMTKHINFKSIKYKIANT